MPASDRLAELRRQRAQIQDHLAWLDREIAREEKGAGAADSAPLGGAAATRPLGSSAPFSGIIPVKPAESAAAASGTTGSEAPAAGSRGTAAATAAAEAVQDADAVMEEYRVPTTDLQKDVRNGCLLYFAAAVLILAGIVVVLYYALRR